MLWILVDDGAVLQVPEVKHAHRPVRPHGGKHVPAPTCPAERDVIHLHINMMSYTCTPTRDVMHLHTNM